HTLVNIEGGGTGIARRQPLAAAQRHLPVGTIEAAIDAVRCGFCFGWLPAYRIQAALDSGELIPLRLSTGGERQVRLNLVCPGMGLPPESRNLAQKSVAPPAFTTAARTMFGPFFSVMRLDTPSSITVCRSL